MNNADSTVKCNKVAKVMGSKIDPKVKLQIISTNSLCFQFVVRKNAILVLFGPDLSEPHLSTSK